MVQFAINDSLMVYQNRIDGIMGEEAVPGASSVAIVLSNVQIVESDAGQRRRKTVIINLGLDQFR